ncbi:hypothetical protein CANCADRAFT_4280 [Tortispora caseinolytica NRRL Y-17796]|uniref:RNA polymerase II transcription factor B subunit 3 n=1 Tax=Tortispora caseinolytica NRRL Y-17796 TaxID=767744 RepID=A0A1E4TD02_9ASCO|nr:hypothetical protein CANCADRAFT_4280 [Tortispora caseinolytica NRRL Y-17796]
MAGKDDEDTCYVCKSSRYLNPEMRFLINTECYHKMCSNCVDRIFSYGPGPCPYPGCDKILRKNKFKEQLFDDIGVEKEVDCRARVMKVYNKTEQDFDSLEEYNAYLEEIEDLVFSLVNGVNVSEVEAKLEAQRAVKTEPRQPKKDIGGVPATPFTPFNGDRGANTLIALSDSLHDPLNEKLIDQKEFSASGYVPQVYYRRALFEAFMGICCFIDAEKTRPIETT